MSTVPIIFTMALNGLLVTRPAMYVMSNMHVLVRDTLPNIPINTESDVLHLGYHNYIYLQSKSIDPYIKTDSHTLTFSIM